MAMPQNLQINLNAPFPSLVTGTGPITIGKQNGIWTVGFNTANFAVQNLPPQSALATDYVLIYDSVAKQFVNVPLLSLLAVRFLAGGSIVDFNAANSDTAITIASPTPVYRIVNIIIAHATASISTATWGLFQNTGGGGIAVFPAGQTLTVTGVNPNTGVNSVQVAAPATSNTLMWNLTTLFFRVGTAQGSPAHASVYVWIEPLP